jgi:hypothetical protein
MNRKEFFKTCGFGVFRNYRCNIVAKLPSLILSKRNQRIRYFVNAFSDFEITKERETAYKKYIIIPK